MLRDPGPRRNHSLAALSLGERIPVSTSQLQGWFAEAALEGGGDRHADREPHLSSNRDDPQRLPKLEIDVMLSYTGVEGRGRKEGPAPQPGFDRIEPSCPGEQRQLAVHLRATLIHGVVSAGTPTPVIAR